MTNEKVMTAFQMTKDDREKLRELAKSKDLSMSQMIRKLIREATK